MLDQDMIANIRDSGLVRGAYRAEKRDRRLREELGFRVSDRAEYALLASCFLPSFVPQDMRAFSNLLHHFEVDYTLLPKEYCCGNLLFRQAVEDENGEDLLQADLLSREFIENNLQQAREVGASKVVTFCGGCNEVYSRSKDTIPEEVMWYPTLLAGVFGGGMLELQADYYAGCYAFYRSLNSGLPDLESPLMILNRIEGLELNQLDSSLCCNDPEQVESLIGSIRNKTIITICGGCAMWLQQALKDRGDYRVVMLPEVAWAAIRGDRRISATFHVVWPPVP